MGLRERAGVGSLAMLRGGFWCAALLLVSFVHVTSPPLLLALAFGLALATDVLWCNAHMHNLHAQKNFPKKPSKKAFKKKLSKKKKAFSYKIFLYTHMPSRSHIARPDGQVVSGRARGA